ncbi:hypothetical protein E4U13_005083 [Claviceps humidiphila]|uniref:Uncharacterized protein n=2 Tax=Claviceps TaxID=5110 RepID=A0A9P7MVE4_9HYPO|nr:hypothetical protein E4U57_002619 [Claviceps arundinis]KAG5970797.1 hypothetical protein E4U56_007267 [Claviceps arundinis]KAG6063653.1 hypothetical protein E4U32_001036 [Claviceps aff. humidiphila group G2b]KAG6111096.1 hypothetical protein E4U13_005083 [Claviceps humidiphila]
MSYNVYRVVSLGVPRNHQAIFVVINADGSGDVFHVTGNIQEGMTYEHEAREPPESSATFLEKRLLGRVSIDQYEQFKSICKGVAPPKKQFNGPKRLFPKEPLRRCGEWADEATQALLSSGILQAAEQVAQNPEPCE